MSEAETVSIKSVRVEALSTLLIATSLRAAGHLKDNPFKVKAEQETLLAKRAVSILSTLSVSDAQKAIDAATGDVRTLIASMKAPSPIDLTAAVSALVLLLHSSKKSTPPEIRIATEILMGEMLERPDAAHESAKRSVIALSICNQLHSEALSS